MGNGLATKRNTRKRLQSLLAFVMLLVAFDPLSNAAPVSADSFAAVFAYDPTTISQEVSVANFDITSQFTMTASVAKAWANDNGPGLLDLQGDDLRAFIASEHRRGLSPK